MCKCGKIIGFLRVFFLMHDPIATVFVVHIITMHNHFLLGRSPSTCVFDEMIIGFEVLADTVVLQSFILAPAYFMLRCKNDDDSIHTLLSMLVLIH